MSYQGSAEIIHEKSSGGTNSETDVSGWLVQLVVIIS